MIESKEALLKELQEKSPRCRGGEAMSFIRTHSVPPQVSFERYAKWMLETAREIYDASR